MGRIIRSVIGVVAGIAITIVLIVIFEAISAVMFPPAEGTNMADMEQMKAYIAGLPTIALVLYLVYHGIATFCGAFVGAYIAGRSHIAHAMVVGALPLIGAIVNLAYIPHPTWFIAPALLTYPVTAFVAGVLAALKQRPKK
jgi:uncharacterized membrane protein (DUF485 family)